MFNDGWWLKHRAPGVSRDEQQRRDRLSNKLYHDGGKIGEGQDEDDIVSISTFSISTKCWLAIRQNVTMAAEEVPLQNSELFDVSDCVAVVTGGGTGMGLMMAKALEANGAKVYILGRRLAVLEAAAKQATYGNIYPLQCDITSKDDLETAVERIASEDGFVNLVVNNAGISTPNLGPQRTRPNAKWSITDLRNYWFSKPSFEDYARVLEANTTAPLMVTFAFLELLDRGNRVRAEQAKANGGRSDYVRSQVIMVSSVGGFGRDNSAFIYGASKAGTTQMTKNLSTYLTPWKIRANVLAPGYFHTEMTQDFYKSTGGRLPATMTPEERFGDMQEISGTLLYMASKAGAYCNGSVMLSDGGYLAIHPSAY
ncbi:short chain dehydrogenase/reductase family protein [Trichophyton benhamiae CBS 112371]|uniref:Short chain dehydrogenase/reductase family protein n=1 Tax=Arthroderma benhamiae (strain ATCC MYA-4681 / CBS 112371) TaxID=663331 RepID=D4AUS5_ARTBC|nr:short chain dehydrogenase/reductase family protein [Trichophyton benhamiae CBS 112371]EFE33240.1 short chain dehydrogenase/reductase family protein [Trichophyton benhamiae CBS 112371]